MKYSPIRQGSGPALVFQHGFLSGPTYWSNQIKYFSREFQVIATQLPGFAGNTSTAYDRIEDCADSLIRCVDESGVDTFHLMGHSMGGMIAQEVALRYPERVNKLVLYGTGPYGQLPGRFETIEQSRQRVLNGELDKTIYDTVASWFLDFDDADDFSESLRIARVVTQEAVLASYHAWENWSSIDRLSTLKNKTMVLWGDQDRSYSWPQPEALWKGIQGAALGVLPGCAHNAHLENPKLFNQMLSQFLSA